MNKLEVKTYTNSVASLNNTVYQYIKELVNEYLPEVDTSDNSPFADTFIAPLTLVLGDLIDRIDHTDLIQDITNAELMTAEEINSIGEHNYGVTRNAGNRATGQVKVTMAQDKVIADVIIDPITVQKGDLRYFGTRTICKFNTSSVPSGTGTVLPGTVADYYNSQTNKYEFPVFITAEDLGSMYNAEPGEINTLVTKLPLLDDYVYNELAITNGSDDEELSSYVSRIRQFRKSQHVGTDPGYERFIKESFPEVTDVVSIGYGDEDMQRDIIKYTDHLNQQVSTHIGGKGDIYLKDKVAALAKQTAYINSNKVRLVHPTLMYEDGIKIINITSPAKAEPTYTLSKLSEGAVDVVITPAPSTTLDGDTLEIRYLVALKGDDGLPNGDSFMYSQYFMYNTNKINLYYQPLISIQSVSAAGTPVDLSQVVLEDKTKPAEVGSVRNNIWVTITNATPNTLVDLTYTYNRIVYELQEQLDQKEYRPVTADILVKDAAPVYIYISLDVTPIPSYKITANDKARLTGIVNDYIDNRPFGSDIHATDIVDAVMTDEALKRVIKYIKLPFVFFGDMTANVVNSAEALGNLTDPKYFNSIIKTGRISYPSLRYLNIREILDKKVI